VFDRVRCLGDNGAPFDFLEFAIPAQGAGGLARRLGLHRLAALGNVLRGEMSLVGPRSAPVGELSPRDPGARARYRVRPGLVGPWWIRQRTNVAYGAEADADQEYVTTWSVRGDLGILARAVLALAYGGRGAQQMDPRVSMLGVSIDNLTMDEALDTIGGWLDTKKRHQVAFVNADCLNIAWRNLAYRHVLAGAALTLGDGIGLKIGGALLGRPIRQNVNGTDLFPRLCELASRTQARIFLLGARPEVVDGVRDWIAARHGAAVVCGTQHGYFDAADEPAVLERIRASRADILLVALGAPRQDQWLAAHLAATGATVGIGVGGLFDFYSGRIPRAPMWMREIGLEWAFRLYQEPRRMWRRYLVGNVQFVTRVLRERWGFATRVLES
jgi:N-acetylglucosaminyldiphosphoundecaprenol N-acetyl-beta-D-mannosaminyltransferase